MSPSPALDITHLSYAYGERQALRDVTFSVQPGEVFGLLGPNGGGKTTLFRIVSTLRPAQEGSARVFGDDVTTQAAAARRRMGIVFQSPALDIRLTVAENLRHHGRLYGLHGGELSRRITEVLGRVRLQDRAGDLVLTLSGGQRRRVEVAKAILPKPALLVLDEPSTGLDPTARRDLWDDLRGLRDREGTTVVLTTHLMDEAALCDRVAILHEGRLVAIGTPDALVREVGGDVILITARDPEALAAGLHDRFGIEAHVFDSRLRIERARAHEFVPHLVEAFPGAIEAVTFGKPTLEDVFVHQTGRRLE